MTLAQRFPWDFDGIVAGAPAIDLMGVAMNYLWANRVLTDKEGNSILKLDDLEILHRGVLNKCDLNDGIKDGIIGDPRPCRFDPSELACRVADQRGCLDSQQIDAIRKIYAGLVTTGGEQIFLPAVLKGSELSWGSFVGSEKSTTPLYVYMGDFFRYFGFSPEPWPTLEARILRLRP